MIRQRHVPSEELLEQGERDTAAAARREEFGEDEDEDILGPLRTEQQQYALGGGGGGDNAHAHAHATTSWRKRFFSWRNMSRPQRGCAICGVGSLVLVVLLLVCYFAVLPGVISSYASKGKYSFLNVTMTDPTTDSVRLFCAVEITCDMPVAATTSATTASFIFNGTVVGTFDFCEMSFPQGNHTTRVTNTDTLVIRDMSVFSTLAKIMLMDTSSSWTLDLTVTVWAHVGGGLSVPFYGVHLRQDILVPGLGGFGSAELVKYDVLVGSDGKAQSYVAVKYNDNCIISVNPIGTVVMDAYVLGARQATLTMTDLAVQTGPNILVGVGDVDPSNQTVLSYVFNRYLNGKNVTISSVARSCSIPLYDKIFKDFELSYVLQGNDANTNPLVMAALIVLDKKMILEGLLHGLLVVPAQLYIHYQFTAPITFTEFHLSVTHNGTVLGGYDGPMDPPLIVPGNSKFLTRVILVTAHLNRANIKQFLMGIHEELKHGITQLGIEGSFTFKVANVQASAETIQPPVPTCLPDQREKCGIPYAIDAM